MKIPELKDLRRDLMDEGTRSERWIWKIRGTNIRHHPTRPARQYKNGDWFWFWMDKHHRWDGPAVFWNGEYEYWINGKELTKEEWENHPQRLEWIKNQIEGI